VCLREFGGKVANAACSWGGVLRSPEEPRLPILPLTTMSRTGFAAICGALLLAAAGCTGHPGAVGARPQATTPTLTGTTADPLPSAVRLACGHPGRSVLLTVRELVVRRSSCDLRGVRLAYGGISVTVPERGGAGALAHADGPSGSSTTSASVDVSSGDVTFRVAQS